MSMSRGRVGAGARQACLASRNSSLSVRSRFNVTLSRSVSSSILTSNQSTSTTTTTSTSSSSSSSSFIPSSSSISASPSSSPSTTSTSTDLANSVFLANQILKTSWLPIHSARHRELSSFISSPTNSSIPSSLSQLYSTIRSYRSVRSKLWIPNSIELFKSKKRFNLLSKYESSAQSFCENSLASGKMNLGHLTQDQLASGSLSSEESDNYLRILFVSTQRWMKPSSRKSFSKLEDEEKKDEVFKLVWTSLTNEERDQANVRAGFECIRRVGWRKGFTSGYPLGMKEGEEVLKGREDQLKALLPYPNSVSKSQEITTKLVEAKRNLEISEESSAYKAWLSLTPLERLQEEKGTWEMRDRGKLYLSGSNRKKNSQDEVLTKVLGTFHPRWYAQPIRTGELIFLPNVLVRLVKNSTPQNEAYDPWKATFRIPYSMHKHALKSYLLSIYGLRVTWIRTMIYRSSRARLAPGGARDYRSRGFGRRNFKKAEVGLLEPFVFPEIGERFLREKLLGDEMEIERMAGMIQLRGGKRWRGKRLPDVYANGQDQKVETMGTDVHHDTSAKEAETEIIVSTSNVEGETVQRMEHLKGGKKDRLANRPKLLTRGRGIPTARHSRILQMLGWKREEREEKIKEIMDRERLDAGKQ